MIKNILYYLFGIKRRDGTMTTCKDCLFHMEKLKRSFGNIIKFEYTECLTEKGGEK